MSHRMQRMGGFGARTANAEAESLLEGSIPSIRNTAYTQQLVSKHRRLLDETINPKWHNSDMLKRATAMLMENALRHHQAQRAASFGGLTAMLTESGTSTSDLDAYKQTIFPLLLNVFPNLIANEIVSVQPTSGPQALIYYMQAVHSKAKGATQAGTDIHKSFDPSYSSEQVRNEPIGVGNGVLYGGAGGALSYGLAFTPVMPKRTSTDSPTIEVVIEEVDSSGAVVQSAVDNGQGGFVFTPAGGNTAGAINYATGQITGFKFQNAPATGNLIRSSYRYDMEGNQNRPTISLNTRSVSVETEEYALKAEWTVEAMQDLIAQQGVDAQAEILSLISDKIQLDIDRTILHDLHNGAQYGAVWNRAGAPTGVNELDYLRTLVTKISEMGAQIHTGSGRAPANFGVVSPMVSGLLDQLNTNGDFIPAAPVEERPTSYGPRNSDFGIFKVGSLRYRVSIYQDPGWADNQILLGLRGSDYLDAGYVWAPYVALYMTPVFQDPTDGKNKQLFMSRSARKMLRPEYYGKISILNM
jgi:hypothetical protein